MADDTAQQENPRHIPLGSGWTLVEMAHRLGMGGALREARVSKPPIVGSPRFWWLLYIIFRERFGGRTAPRADRHHAEPG